MTTTSETGEPRSENLGAVTSTLATKSRTQNSSFRQIFIEDGGSLGFSEIGRPSLVLPPSDSLSSKTLNTPNPDLLPSHHTLIISRWTEANTVHFYTFMSI